MEGVNITVRFQNKMYIKITISKLPLNGNGRCPVKFHIKSKMLEPTHKMLEPSNRHHPISTKKAQICCIELQE